ncbi:MAG: protein phosphatase 2C domain-containing protein [Desulfovibrio sp.]
MNNNYHIASIHEQGCGAFNEDACHVGNNTFAVLDGASSLNGDLFSGKSGAWWAAHTACNTIAKADQNAAITDSSDLQQAMQRANDELQSMMQEHHIDTSAAENVWSTCAAAVTISNGEIHWSQIGDALLIAIDHQGNHFLPAPYHNHDRTTLTKWKALAQSSNANVFSELLPDIIAVRREMNKSYGVLNGDSKMTRFLKTGTLQRKDVAELLLFTDGLHIPSEDPDSKGDFSELVQKYQQYGLHGLRDEVRKIEEIDPNCCLYPRFKQHDDIAAIALSF